MLLIVFKDKGCPAAFRMTNLKTRNCEDKSGKPVARERGKRLRIRKRRTLLKTISEHKVTAGGYDS